jgi:hypothetical protein
VLPVWRRPPPLSLSVICRLSEPSYLARQVQPDTRPSCRRGPDRAADPRTEHGRAPSAHNAKRHSATRQSLGPGCRGVSQTATPVIRASAFPAALVPGIARAAGRTHRMHARLGGTRQASTRPQRGPWPSVESRRCTPTVRGHQSRPLCVRGHRDTGTYSATR